MISVSGLSLKSCGWLISGQVPLSVRREVQSAPWLCRGLKMGSLWLAFIFTSGQSDEAWVFAFGWFGLVFFSILRRKCDKGVGQVADIFRSHTSEYLSLWTSQIFSV